MPAAELMPGDRRVVRAGTFDVGVFNVNGRVVAVQDLCPHERVPICGGRVDGTTLPSSYGRFEWARDGEILACPWHGWEFDLRTGAVLRGPADRPIAVFPVAERDGRLEVEVPG
mgnify:CR=1 FL=1